MQTHHLSLLLIFLSITTSSVPPSCALNYPCPPPTWTPQWQLNLSTICQPSSPGGYFLPPPDKPWGLISLDWSNAEAIWLNKNPNMSTCEATNIDNGRRIKMTSPNTKVFIYHNMELALQWIESQRAVMYDPSKANWFLQYTDGKGHKNGTIYNEARGEGDQYFWDFRVPEAAAYFINSVVESVNSPYVDGSFADDIEGLPVEHDSAPVRMKLSAQEVEDIQQATQSTSQQLILRLIKAGKYLWQAFSSQDNVGPAPSQGSCVSFMRKFCDPMMQSNPMTMGFSTQNPSQVLAAFLITRPPYGWLGFGWESDMRNWDPLFNLDVGKPLGLCKESPTGVFSRVWSKGTVELDCNSWKATLPA